MGWGGGGGGKFVPPTVKRLLKFRDFEELLISSLVFNKSLSNLALVLILRRSFQWCPRIFPNLSMSKVEKNREKVYWFTHASLRWVICFLDYDHNKPCLDACWRNSKLIKAPSLEHLHVNSQTVQQYTLHSCLE